MPGIALVLAAPARASSVQQTQQASVTFIEAATPKDGTNFSFITDLPGTPLVTLDDANPDDNDGISNTFTTLVDPGSYNVIESVQAGWNLAGINCVKSDPGIGVTVVNNLLFFTISGNQSLTCTFTNVKTGSLTVVKKADPADGTDFPINLGGDRTGQVIVDVIVGTSRSDKINAKEGNDIVCGGNGNGEIKGGPGNDQLFGETGRDELEGETGDDILTGGTGADEFKGGSGRDTATDYNRHEGDTKSSIEQM